MYTHIGACESSISSPILQTMCVAGVPEMIGYAVDRYGFRTNYLSSIFGFKFQYDFCSQQHNSIKQGKQEASRGPPQVICMYWPKLSAWVEEFCILKDLCWSLENSLLINVIGCKIHSTNLLQKDKGNGR